MDAGDIYHRITATLREEFRSAGRGSITATEVALGLYPGFYRKSGRAQSMRLIVLAATLEHLEVDPGEFFAKAFAVPESAEAPTADAGREPSPEPTNPTPYRPTEAQVTAALKFFEGTTPERRS